MYTLFEVFGRTRKSVEYRITNLITTNAIINYGAYNIKKVRLYYVLNYFVPRVVFGDVPVYLVFIKNMPCKLQDVRIYFCIFLKSN